MATLTQNIEAALRQYALQLNQPQACQNAVHYLTWMIQQHASDLQLRNTISYLLNQSFAPLGTPQQLVPIHNTPLAVLLTNALGQQVQNARKHLIILLNGWDWVQLTNVHKYVAKHGSGDVDVTTLRRLSGALRGLGNDSKIHIVGHGEPNSFAQGSGTTPEDLADDINQDLPLNTRIKIRVDTCSSAVADVNNHTAAQTIKTRLVATHGRRANDIEVTGTVGPSVTGIDGKRIVVDPNQVPTAATIQSTLEFVYRDGIAQATNLCATINGNSQSAAIKAAAQRAWGFTQGFFGDFEYLLNNWAVHANGSDLVVAHNNKQHKVAY